MAIEPALAVGTRVDAEATVVVARGEIDLQTSALLRAQLLDAIEQAAGLVVLDASGVDFVSSAGLALLVTAQQHGELCNRRFCIVIGEQRAIVRALHVAGLERYVRTYRTYAEALAAHRTDSLRGDQATGRSAS